MLQVAITHSETAGSAHLVPLSVDGLVVASICLVEIGARLGALAVPRAGTSGAQHTIGSTADGPFPQCPQDQAAEEPDREPDDDGNTQRRDGGQVSQVFHDTHSGAAHYRDDHEEPRARRRVQARASTGTAKAVARLRRRNPALTPAQIAALLNIHPSTVRRHLNARKARQPARRRRRREHPSAGEHAH